MNPMDTYAAGCEHIDGEFFHKGSELTWCK